MTAEPTVPREAPQYRIAALTDFTKVPEARLGDCLEEFALWVDMQRQLREVVARLMPDADLDALIANETFTWIDDGLRNVDLNIQADDADIHVSIPQDGQATLTVASHLDIPAMGPDGAPRAP